MGICILFLKIECKLRWDKESTIYKMPSIEYYANRGVFSNINRLTSMLMIALLALPSVSQLKMSNSTRCSKCVCFSFPRGLAHIFLSNVTSVAHQTTTLSNACLVPKVIEAEADNLSTNQDFWLSLLTRSIGSVCSCFLSFFPHFILLKPLQWLAN